MKSFHLWAFYDESAFCSGCGASVGSASGLLGPVCDGRNCAAEPGPFDHRECKLLCHPREKYVPTQVTLLLQYFYKDLKHFEEVWEGNSVCLFLAVSMLGPLTTPEHQLSKTPSSSSLSQRMRNTLTPR